MAAEFERFYLKDLKDLTFRFTSCRLILKKEASLSSGNSRGFAGNYIFGCGQENESFKKFSRLVRTLCLRIQYVHADEARGSGLGYLDNTNHLNFCFNNIKQVNVKLFKI